MDPALACALSSIASVLNACQLSLDYVAMPPHAPIYYHARKMIVAVHWDASYLSEPDSKSHMGGHYFLNDHDSNAPNNGTILTLAISMRGVVFSASEVELATLFYTYKKRQCPCGKHLRKWVTTSLKPLSQMITLQHVALLLTQWFLQHQKPWACSSTVSNVISSEKRISKPCWLSH